LSDATYRMRLGCLTRAGHCLVRSGAGPRLARWCGEGAPKVQAPFVLQHKRERPHKTNKTAIGVQSTSGAGSARTLAITTAAGAAAPCTRMKLRRRWGHCPVTFGSAAAPSRTATDTPGPGRHWHRIPMIPPTPPTQPFPPNRALLAYTKAPRTYTACRADKNQ
jgi:hypothetical protein